MCVIICGSVRLLVTCSASFGVFLLNDGSFDAFVCLRKSLVNLHSERKQTQARMSLKVAIGSETDPRTSAFMLLSSGHAEFSARLNTLCSLFVVD